MDLSNNAKDLIEKEVSAFDQSPDNSLYMLPATPQVRLSAEVLDTVSWFSAFKYHFLTDLSLNWWYDCYVDESVCYLQCTEYWILIIKFLSFVGD